MGRMPPENVLGGPGGTGFWSGSRAGALGSERTLTPLFFFQLCSLSRLLNPSLGFLAFKFEVIKAPTPSGCLGGFNGRTDVKHLAQHLAHSKCSINTRGYRECHFSVRGGG